MVEAEAPGDGINVPVEELKEEKLRRAKAWIVKWGLVFTLLIVVIWPVLSLPARKSSLTHTYTYIYQNYICLSKLSVWLKV